VPAAKPPRPLVTNHSLRLAVSQLPVMSRPMTVETRSRHSLFPSPVIYSCPRVRQVRPEPPAVCSGGNQPTVSPVHKHTGTEESIPTGHVGRERPRSPLRAALECRKSPPLRFCAARALGSRTPSRTGNMRCISFSEVGAAPDDDRCPDQFLSAPERRASCTAL
jgi:hypothetical protein